MLQKRGARKRLLPGEKRCQNNDLKLVKSPSDIFKRSTEVQTTWLNTNSELIGVQNKHIEDLGINILNYKKPKFLERAKAKPKGTPSSEVFELIRDQCLYNVMKLCSSTKPSKNGTRFVEPNFKNRICTPLRRKPIAKILKSQELNMLLNSQYVKRLSIREVYERAQLKAQQRHVQRSRVVKDMRRPFHRQRLSLTQRKQQSSQALHSESNYNLVQWISIIRPTTAWPQVAEILPTLFNFGSLIDFEIVKTECNLIMLSDRSQPGTISQPTNTKRKWICLIVLVLLGLLTTPQLLELLPNGSNNTILRLAIYICHIFILFFVKSV